MADHNKNFRDEHRHRDWEDDDSPRNERGETFEDRGYATRYHENRNRNLNRSWEEDDFDRFPESRSSRNDEYTGRYRDTDRNFNEYGSWRNRSKDYDDFNRGGLGRSYGNNAYGGNYSRTRFGRDYDDNFNRFTGGSTRTGGHDDYGRGRQGSNEGLYGTRGYPGGYDSRGNRDWWDRTTDEVASWFGDDDAERRRRRDKIEGQYKGKGPKGYKRSDDRVLEDINDRLSDDPFVDASDVDVKVSNGEVTLSGKVSDRHTKRRAEDIAEEVSGVSHVENRLRVRSSLDEAQTSNIETPDAHTSSDTTENRR